MGIDDFILTATTAATNTITAPTIASGFPACVTTSTGQALGAISFTSAGAGFTGSVTYTAQLSDASGSFTSPTTLGSVTNSSGPGTYSITTTSVPAGTVSGTGYAVRVVTSTPAVTGSSLTGQTVALAPTNFAVSVAGTSPQTFSTPSSGSLLTASVGSFTPTGAATGVTYQWKYGTSSGGPYTSTISGATSATYTPQGSDFGAGTAGNYFLVAEATSTVTCATVVRTSSQVPITTTAPAPAATVKQGATTYPSGGTAYVFGTAVALGSSSSAVTFTIQNTGSATLNLSGFTASGDFNASAPVSTTLAASASTTFTVTFTPTATGTRTGSITIPSNDPATPYVLNLSATGSPSASSDLIFNASFTYNNTGIDYAAYQSAAITNATNSPVAGAGVPIYSFTARDGGGAADADALPTILDGLVFSSVQGIGSIRNAALFNGTALVSNAPTINVGAGTITFSGLVAALTPGGNVGRVTVADNGTANFTLRVTFNNTAALVVDNTQLRVSITSANATAATSGSSTFGSFTTLVSSTATNDNRINVIATKLVYSPTPPATAGVNVNFTVGVVAQDANNIQDTDFRGGSVPSVTLGRGAGTGTFTATSGLTKTLTGGAATWTDIQYDVIETGVGLVTTNTGGLTNTSATMAFVAFSGILWDGGAGTDAWTDALNWSTNTVPTASDDVRLDNSAVTGSYSVTIGSTPAVAKSLQVGYSGNPGTITLNITSATASADILLLGGGTLPALAIAQGGVVINAITGASSSGVTFSSTADTWTMTDDARYAQNTNRAFPNIALGKTTFATTSTFEISSTAATNWANGGIGRVKRYGNLVTVNSVTITLASGLNTTDSVIVAGNWTHSGSLVRFVNSGTDQVRVRVKGNLTVGTGGIIRAAEGGGNAFTELIVEGNITTTGTGTVGGTGSSSIGRVVVGGSFTGSYSAGAATDDLVFSPVGGNTAVSTFTLSGTISVRKLTINKSVMLGSGIAPTISSTVSATGTLDFNFFTVTGAGQFTLVAGGTLKITDPSGITQAAATPTGNVRSSGLRTFPNGATYWYTGIVAQVTGTGLPTTTGQKIIICDNPTTLTLTDPSSGVNVGISLPGGLDIRQGTFIETATAEISGGGNLTMSGGTYRIVKTGTSALPQLSASPYTLTGGTIELAGAGAQTLRGSRSYQGLTFTNSGTKILSSAIAGDPVLMTGNLVNGTVTISGSALLNLTGQSFNGPGGLTMTGTSGMKLTVSGTQPGLVGAYSLTGGTIEFNGSNPGTTQTIRGNQLSPVLNRTYFNIDVTGTNVGASNGDFAIGSGGTMTVRTGGSFVMTDQTISGAGAFTTEAGSTFGYGSSLGINSSGATGNIQTGTRTFDSGGSYILRGTFDMVTGTGLPATVDNLTADLTATKVATLTNATTVTSALTLTEGYIALGNNDLTLGTATLTGGSANSYVQTDNNPTATGELIRTVPNTATNILYPVGTSTYTPAQVAQTAGATSDAFAVRVFDGVLLGGTTGTAVTSDVVNRTWMVSEGTVGGSNATLTVQWNGTEELSGFGRSLSRIGHFTGGAYDKVTGGSPLLAATGSDPYQQTRSGLTSFSPFAVGDDDSPLPVELSRFTATITPQRTVAVSWTTASEKDAAYFEVLRSADGREFTPIGTQTAQGTTNTAHDYRFDDVKPLSGVSFYRLRQVDLDGTATLSDAVSVRFGTPLTAGFTAFPQPFAAALTLRIDAPVAGEAAVKLYDLNGRTVLTQAANLAAGTTDVVLTTQALAAGTYVVQVTLPGGQTLRTRVVR